LSAVNGLISFSWNRKLITRALNDSANKGPTIERICDIASMINIAIFSVS
jgi:hypothetical protein